MFGATYCNSNTHNLTLKPILDSNTCMYISVTSDLDNLPSHDLLLLLLDDDVVAGPGHAAVPVLAHLLPGATHARLGDWVAVGKRMILKYQKKLVFSPL